MTALRTLATIFLYGVGVAGALAQTCNFSISNVNFGTDTLLSGSAIDSSATLDISCQNFLNVSLAVRICPNINVGSGGASAGIRTMSEPAGHKINYQLYQNAARTTTWGSVDQPALGSPPAIDLLLLPLTATTAQRTIYGRILANQQTAYGGSYLSTFAGSEVRINYDSYLVFPPACSAVTQNPTPSNFLVQAFNSRTCSVTAQNINFGSRTTLGTNTDAVGGVGVTCTPSLPYSIALNGGTTGGTPTQRKMSHGANTITYGLYKDAARAQPWGDTAGQTLSGTGSGALQNLTVYGRVPTQTTPSSGTYTDTVVVTITY